MHFIIVGAGLAGLAVAVALQREGHSITVVERTPELTEAGAGVILGPHAMAALAWLGADSHIRTINRRFDLLHHYDALSGELRLSTELGKVGQALFGSPYYGSHRRDVIDALAMQLQDGTDIRLGKSVVGVEQTESRVTVTLNDGSSLDGDALIGADGLRSTVRGIVFGDVSAISAGLLAWRTVLPMEKLRRPLPKHVSVWMGGGHHAVAYPIRQGKQFYSAFYVFANEVTREDWGQAGDVKDLHASFKGACDNLRELVLSIDEAFITGLAYREPLAQWHSGRVLLVGDAAHSVIPTAGSGAALGLEDAVALVYCLRRKHNDLDAAFRDFQARRKPRTTSVLKTALADLHAWHATGETRTIAGAARARGLLRLDPTGHSRTDWLLGYNEVVQSQRPTEEILSLLDLPKRLEARQAFASWQNADELEDSLEEWLTERESYERFLAQVSPVPNDVVIEEVNEGPVRGVLVKHTRGDHGQAVLHLHGGYGVYGSAQSGIGMAAKIAKAFGGWAFVPEYRLVPEHNAAAMAGDVSNAYAWLQSRAEAIIVSGEDVGALLAVKLSQMLRDTGKRLPRALYLLSPFVDMTLEAASIDRNARTDPWVNRLRLVKWAGSYIQDRDPSDPEISPVYGTMTGLPPIRIYAASGEALASDARMLYHVARRAGLDVTLREVNDSVHRYALFDVLPETRTFLADIAADVKSLGTRNGKT